MLSYVRPYPVFEEPLGPDDLIKDVLANLGVDSREGVVQQVDSTVTVDRPGNADTLLLTPRQVDALQRDTWKP